MAGDRAVSQADLGRATRRAIVPLGLPVLLFGGIFSGAATVTEAALLAVVYAMAVEWWMGELRPAASCRSLRAERRRHRHDAVGAGGCVGLCLDSGARVGAAGARRMDRRQSAPDPSGFMALTILVFVLIGALLEGLPALLIFGPILFPISRTVGVDPVHYGIVIVAAMGIAFFLPPVGVGLTIAAGIGRVDIDEVSRAYVPYLVALLIGLALIAALPGLTLVLPRLFLGYGG